MAISLTDVQEFYKTFYPRNRSHDLTERLAPFWQWVKKAPTLLGRSGRILVPLETVNPSSISVNLATAIANANSMGGEEWSITRAREYGVLDFEIETILRSRNEKSAFFRQKQRQGDKILEQMGRLINAKLVRGNGGALGTISAIATNTITLTDAAEVKAFEVGMPLQAADSLGGTLLNTGGTQTVTAVDHSNNQITLNGNFGGGTTPGTTLLFAAETTGAGSQDNTLSITSLADHFPLGAPPALYGVTRTSNRERLAGNVVNQPNDSIYVNISNLARKCSDFGGRDLTCWMNTIKFQQLLFEEENKIVKTAPVTATQKLVTGLGGVMIATQAGTVNVMGDVDFPTNRFYLLDRDSFEVIYTPSMDGRGPIHIANEDGLNGLRGSNTDTLQVRWRTFFQSVCYQPNRNGVGALAQELNDA